MDIMGVAHRLEYKSFDTYPAKDFLEFVYAQWHPHLGPYECSVTLPNQMGTNVKLQTENISWS
jgi:hypothetical protein